LYCLLEWVEGVLQRAAALATVEVGQMSCERRDLFLFAGIGGVLAAVALAAAAEPEETVPERWD
jgi:hypothetical protein